VVYLRGQFIISFIMYINDIDLGINGRILKFADDTKLFNFVSSAEDIACLRNDLHTLCHWSDDWLTLFNVDKCKVMHFGYNNTISSYYIGNTLLPSCTVERDLGIPIQDNIKVSEQCTRAANTANRVLGMINRTFSHKSKLPIDALYNSLVRPELDYYAQAWRPFLKKDIDLLVKVKRRASRMVQEFRGWSYDQRLNFLKWSTLKHRRVRGDMIEVFKLIKSFDIVAPNTFLTCLPPVFVVTIISYINVPVILT
jgi:ribonuclease P/MRP protein subunit RPP40